jgi:hypothetical protein
MALVSAVWEQKATPSFYAVAALRGPSVSLILRPNWQNGLQVLQKQRKENLMSCIFLTGLQQENSKEYKYTICDIHLKALDFLQNPGSAPLKKGLSSQKGPS